MAIRVIDDSKLQNIAVAIQGKDSGGQMTVEQMPTRIAAIPTGEEVLFSDNGRAYAKNMVLSNNVISITNSAYESCNKIETIDCKNVSSIGSNCFKYCTSLEIIDCRNITYLETNTFQACSSLKYADCRNVLSTGVNCFRSCSNLVLVDFTSCDSPPILGGASVFYSTNDTWKAVFKNNEVKVAVQEATNWSTYANHIYTIAEIEAEVGMTYDAYYYQLFGHARNEVAV